MHEQLEKNCRLQDLFASLATWTVKEMASPDQGMWSVGDVLLCAACSWEAFHWLLSKESCQGPSWTRPLLASLSSRQGICKKTHFSVAHANWAISVHSVIVETVSCVIISLQALKLCVLGGFVHPVGWIALLTRNSAWTGCRSVSLVMALNKMQEQRPHVQALLHCNAVLESNYSRSYSQFWK